MTDRATLTALAPEALRESLRGFPPGALEAVLAFRENATSSTLDGAMRAILEFYLPRAVRRSLIDLPGTMRLREDLGVDSLSLAEAVFKWDDLFGVPIETREAAGVQTLDDLHYFLAGKMGLVEPPCAAP